MIENGYRDILRHELARRCSENSGYSLRAFSRDLDLDPAQLSRVLNGKQNISPTTAAAIAHKVFKRERDREYFVSLVELATSRKAQATELALKKVQKLAPSENPIQLQLDVISLISEWYHFAILDLTCIDQFVLTPCSASSYLGITEIEAKLAIERLLNLGLLESKGGKFKKTFAKIATPNGIPSAGLRKFHKQMMLKAIESVDTQSIDQRHLRTKTMSIARSELPKFISLVSEFLEGCDKLVSSKDAPQKKDALYELNVQLFDLKKQKAGKAMR